MTTQKVTVIRRDKNHRITLKLYTLIWYIHYPIWIFLLMPFAHRISRKECIKKRMYFMQNYEHNTSSLQGSYLSSFSLFQLRLGHSPSPSDIRDRVLLISMDTCFSQIGHYILLDLDGVNSMSRHGGSLICHAEGLENPCKKESGSKVYKILTSDSTS